MRFFTPTRCFLTFFFIFSPAHSALPLVGQKIIDQQESPQLCSDCRGASTLHLSTTILSESELSRTLIDSTKVQYHVPNQHLASVKSIDHDSGISNVNSLLVANESTSYLNKIVSRLSIQGRRVMLNAGRQVRWYTKKVSYALNDRTFRSRSDFNHQPQMLAQNISLKTIANQEDILNINHPIKDIHGVAFRRMDSEELSVKTLSRPIGASVRSSSAGQLY